MAIWLLSGCRRRSGLPMDFERTGFGGRGYADRNDYMYGENLEISPTGLLDTWLGQMIEGGEVSYIEPTDVIGKQGGQMIIEGVKIEFMFAPGEAPTDMHFYSPQHKLLHCSDNCYMCLHTVHTIRGAFPRDAMQWANSATE